MKLTHVQRGGLVEKGDVRERSQEAETEPGLEACEGWRECAAVVMSGAEQPEQKGLLAPQPLKSRTLSARLLSAQERERKRIARELHDGIGQRLSAIKFILEGVLDGALPAQESSQGERLQRAVHMTQEAIDEVRRISMALCPAMLDDLGIVMTIEWFCREFQAIYPNIAVRKQVDIAESAMNGLIKTVIFRIMQEAMNNTAKHAGARAVYIELKQLQGEIRLRIEDDGKGFDRKSVAAACRGFGLRSMRERAELAGGRLTVCAAPGEGTVIEAVWQAQSAALFR